MRNPDRRTVLAGLAAFAAPNIARADDSASPIAHGVLAQNPLAQAFESAPPDVPDIMIYGPKGARNISTLFGRTILMPLWAEWCAPCLEEIPDFARLQQKFGNDKFAIVPVLTGPQKKVSPQVIADIFTFLHASVFEPLMEDGMTNNLMMTLARRSEKVEIPCNVLIAPNGKVVAREFGIRQTDQERAQAENSTRSDILARAQTGASLSLWGKPEGEEFAQAMANGFLAS